MNTAGRQGRFLPENRSVKFGVLNRFISGKVEGYQELAVGIQGGEDR